ncbi:FAD dependent oxidoreductase [Xylariomycetidae sp. FL2044]|nr:FAD dependent oxidoreductase [Xylariomycetidae sp. FL2044]
MAPAPLPVPNSTTSFWRSVPHSLDNHRSTPELPGDVDIAVIGSGYAGASTVYHILKSCRDRGLPIPSIVILEARQVCSGATGRNGGHLKPDPYVRPANLARTHGADAASEVAAFEARHLDAVKRLVEEEDIDCDFVLTRCVDALMNEPIYERIKAGVQMLRSHDVPVMRDVFFAEGEQAEILSGVKGAKGCFTYTAAHLFPYKLVTHLLARALEAGVNLQTNTPVTRVDAAAEGKLTLTTPRGPVRATKVVYATNGYASALLPELEGKIIPVRGICSHIVVPPPPPAGREPGRRRGGGRPPPLLANSYIIRRSPTSYEYLVPRLDGSIVVGGGRETYLHKLDSWYGVARDDGLIEEARGHFDGYMQRTFHGWEDSGAETARVWTGIMGYSSDSSPWVGPLPGRRNQYILAGFSGHGMPQAFLTAKGVAAMVVDDEVGFEDSGVPRVWEVTRSRLESTRNVVLEDWEAVHGSVSAKL